MRWTPAVGRAGEQKAAAAQLARAGRVSTQGVQTIVDNMPGGIGAGVYTQAAKALYRMGVNEVGSFAEALKLTGPEGSMGGAVRQVLALGKQGENALKLAYLQGKGEAEVYNAHKAGELGSGKGAVRPDAGTVYRGDKAVSGDKSADEAFFEADGPEHRHGHPPDDAGAGEQRQGLHQGRCGRDVLCRRLGQRNGDARDVPRAEPVERRDGAGRDGPAAELSCAAERRREHRETHPEPPRQVRRGRAAGLTYNQALEEITADAMETVFVTAESFRDFVRQQAAEARMNADARGIIGKVMDKIQNLLESVLADVERFLKKKNPPTPPPRLRRA